MYCLKCKYTSFDHFEMCPKCGSNWEETKKALNLDWVPAPAYAEEVSETPVARSTETQSLQQEEVEIQPHHYEFANSEESEDEGSSLEEIEYPEIDFEEPSEEISHPDLEQLLDSYSMESAPEINFEEGSTDKTEDSGIEESGEELELLDDDLDLDIQEDLDLEETDTDVDRGTGQGSTSDSQNKDSQRGDEEIDISSILDDSEDEDSDKNKT